MKKSLSLTTVLTGLLLCPNLLFAASTTSVTSGAEEGAFAALANPVAIIMLTILIVLLFVIIFLGRIVATSLEYYKSKKQAANSKNKGSKIVSVLLPLLLLTGYHTSAQEATTEAAPAAEAITLIGGMNPTLFYFLFGVFLLEALIIIILISTIRFLVGLEKKKAAKKSKSIHWFEKLNATKSLDPASEAEANWGHSYDGIEELDNPTPPWWMAGFALSVVIGIIYFYRFDIAKTAPDQFQEYAIEVQNGEAAKLAYLASAANKVDENTVTSLTDAADIEAGKTIFVQVCAACHSADGGGTVGPNLTDDYWLHGGGIKNIFRTITVGVPEKGMKSWKDDYTPRQIQQIASFIETLHGTKPATAKAPQGELYKAENKMPAEDSTKTVTGATAAHTQS
ncbi:cbb3-type cytochrome c oxidase N-terminal domain-containing protein [Taibaiella sp. KBW10]|uniref:cbb3-type cytochrome c oxidase N-terminal domain-containing protein n=1 Tax=Taibaiella sp. KBW10 TaxID=2153357 RepID=UPI00131525F9|nr:cbb3-type cytochrome c oxidase N-terminal domain-containing protein [Taibaiella sp. KBW10]